MEVTFYGGQLEANYYKQKHEQMQAKPMTLNSANNKDSVNFEHDIFRLVGL